MKKDERDPDRDKGGFVVTNLAGPKPIGWSQSFTMAEFRYQFVTGTDRRAVRLPRTYVTFYDFDSGENLTDHPGTHGSA